MKFQAKPIGATCSNRAGWQENQARLTRRTAQEPSKVATFLFYSTALLVGALVAFLVFWLLYALMIALSS